MIIDCISDLHGFYPDDLPGGDLLIVAGDLTARDLENEYALFDYWLNKQKYSAKIVIAGNHDNFLQKSGCNSYGFGHRHLQFGTYLEDSGTEFNGLKIWGCPHSLVFKGLNPNCAAFTGNEEDLKKKYDLIPNGIDILISHTPAYGILDKNVDGEHCGSKSLLDAIQRVMPRFVIHGHIHEQGSKIKRIFI